MALNAHHMYPQCLSEHFAHNKSTPQHLETIKKKNGGKKDLMQNAPGKSIGCCWGVSDRKQKKIYLLTCNKGKFCVSCQTHNYSAHHELGGDAGRKSEERAEQLLTDIFPSPRLSAACALSKK